MQTYKSDIVIVHMAFAFQLLSAIGLLILYDITKINYIQVQTQCFVLIHTLI